MAAQMPAWSATTAGTSSHASRGRHSASGKPSSTASVPAASRWTSHGRSATNRAAALACGCASLEAYSTQRRLLPATQTGPACSSLASPEKKYAPATTTIAVRTGQPKRHETAGAATATPPFRRRASSDQAAPAGDGSSGSRHSSSSTSLCTVLPRLEVIAISGTAASHASGRLTRVQSPRAASRLGSPGANSQASARPSHRRGPPLSTGASDRFDGPVAAGVAKGAPGGGAALADPLRHVDLDPVDPHLPHVAAARAHRVRPGPAHRRLLARGEVRVALEHLHVAVVADGQVRERDGPPAPGRVHRDRLPGALPGGAGVGEQPPPRERPRLEPEHPGGHEGDQEHPHEPPRPRRRPLRSRSRPGPQHARHATAPNTNPRPPRHRQRSSPSRWSMRRRRQKVVAI